LVAGVTFACVAPSWAGTYTVAYQGGTVAIYSRKGGTLTLLLSNGYQLSQGEFGGSGAAPNPLISALPPYCVECTGQITATFT
jgi:hypothetical protein